MSAPAGEGRLEREMGFGHAEFERLLPRALAGWSWRRDGDAVQVTVADGAVTIELGPERTRRIALLSLPVTPVTLRWRGLDAATWEAFLRRFDSYYRRGGG